MNINDNLEQSESQNSRIFRYLMEGNRITSLEALKMFGCLRLASHICDLRRIHPEVVINVDKVDTPTQKKVAQYYI